MNTNDMFELCEKKYPGEFTLAEIESLRATGRDGKATLAGKSASLVCEPSPIGTAFYFLSIAPDPNQPRLSFDLPTQKE